MIIFDISKLRASYVYIVKVTTDFVYVVGHRNGEFFAPKGSQVTMYNDMEIAKVRIHSSVGRSFFKNNVMKEFSTPRLATLNYYDGNIISIEIQMYNHRIRGFQEAANWKSNFSKVIQELEKEISTVGDVWINGQEVFWLLDDEDGHNTLSISVDNSMKLHKVKYVKLEHMGLNTYHKLNTATELDSVNQSQDDLLDDINNKAQLSLSEGKVMAYYPNAAYSDLEQICVYSPVIPANGLELSKKERTEEQTVYMINSDLNPCYPNIEFVLRAAKTIGALYGHKETDFLDIPSIIASTGEVNFYNIDQHSRLSTPINMLAIDAISWLFGFIYREKDIDNMRELSSMFRFIISKGLVFDSSISSPFLENAPSQEVPLLDTRFMSKKDALKGIFSLKDYEEYEFNKASK